MRLLITGGGGFLGTSVARALLARGGLASEPSGIPQLTELVLLDQAFPIDLLQDRRIVYLTGDLLDCETLNRACARGFDAAFHLASVVSAGAEADFDWGLRVNLDGTRAVLEACRSQTRQPKLVFTSSVAAFGGPLPATVLDITAPAPQSSYGTQKVIGELLVNDYTRKGYVDGRTVRLPTIVVRPGEPNRAASGFMSNILREPINGVAAVCPVPLDAQMWVMSPQRAVDALLHAIELPKERWGWPRTINVPGITVSVEEALDALARIVGDDARARVRFERDAATEKIVLSWPARFRTDRADSLGFRADDSIDDIITAHLRTLGR